MKFERKELCRWNEREMNEGYVYLDVLYFIQMDREGFTRVLFGYMECRGNLGVFFFFYFWEINLIVLFGSITLAFLVFLWKVNERIFEYYILHEYIEFVCHSQLNKIFIIKHIFLSKFEKIFFQFNILGFYSFSTKRCFSKLTRREMSDSSKLD